MEPATSHHVGSAVPDLSAAAHQMGAATGIRWRPTHDGRLGPWDHRITFSVQGPPYLELVEGPAGSPWDSSAGPRLDPLGYRCHGIDAARDQLTARGAPVDFDATPRGRPFTYHRLEHLGIRIELVDIDQQENFMVTREAPGAALPPLPIQTEEPEDR